MGKTEEGKLESLIDEKRKGLKFGITLQILMKKEVEDGTIFKEPYFTCKVKTVTNKDEILGKIMLGEEEILNRIADWLSKGSQWVIDDILHHYLNVVTYLPLRGNSYIPLPEELRNSKKGLINPKNKDDKCLLWCQVRHLNPAKKDPQRIKLTDKEFSKKLDHSDISFPVQIKDVSKIEKQNAININIFGYDECRLYPIRISNEKYDHHMEFLYITEGEKSHYVYIKDFNR